MWESGEAYGAQLDDGVRAMCTVLMQAVQSATMLSPALRSDLLTLAHDVPTAANAMHAALFSMWACGVQGKIESDVREARRRCDVHMKAANPLGALSPRQFHVLILIADEVTTHFVAATDTSLSTHLAPIMRLTTAPKLVQALSSLATHTLSRSIASVRDFVNDYFSTQSPLVASALAESSRVNDVFDILLARLNHGEHTYIAVRLINTIIRHKVR